MSKTFKPVKTAKAMGNLADTWFDLRAQRLELDKQVKDLQAQESAAKEALLKSLGNEGVTSVGGKTVKVERVPKKKPIAGDWDKIRQYIVENDAWDLLQKRLGVTAVKERWDDDVDIPGIESYDYDDISYSKVKN
jgi:hypothetical protein